MPGRILKNVWDEWMKNAIRDLIKQPSSFWSFKPLDAIWLLRM